MAGTPPDLLPFLVHLLAPRLLNGNPSHEAPRPHLLPRRPGRVPRDPARRGDFDRQTDRAARTRLIGQMRGLRAEREQVRAALPAAKLPALEAVRPSDDPEDLLEQADLLKDNEDKVRKQLQTLEQRIAEA